MVVLATIAAIGALVGAAKLGSARAAHQVPLLFERDYRNFVRITVVAREGSDLQRVLAERGDLGQSTCLRKVFMDRRNLYAYAGYADPVQEDAGRPKESILIMPLSDIALVETQVNAGLCTYN